ncbi:hypothetical protein DPMN_028912 [Dreissena polymorpha]|uniref:Uncharacterized protein n=1 Tax=Dreissena polymorpha TaxID=45954 RepID=A0A9D4LW91_DREPO|nr:hypothetical protein DPMN_028912 [Dreissena polymorpha]
MTLADRYLRWLRSIAVITGVPVNDSVQLWGFRVLAEHRGQMKYSTAKAEQTYFAIRRVKAQRVDAEDSAVCGDTLHFAARLRFCSLRQAAIRDMMLSRWAS